VVIRAGQFRGRPLGDLLLRGKQEALRAFEPLTGAAYDDDSLSRYRAAFDRLEAGEAGALPAFAGLVGLRPDDGVAAFHLRRLLNGSSGTRVEVQ
jgi:adenylate cyclase